MAFRLLGSSFPSHITTGSLVTKALLNKNEKLSKEYNLKTSLKHKSRDIFERGSTITTCEKHDEKKYLMNVTQSSHDEAEPHSKTIFNSIIHALDAFRKFSRFYAFIAMIVGSFSSSLLAVDNLSELSPTFFNGFLQYVAAFFFMHMYIVGVNQLADLEIDKINKPYLPLASGDFSFRNGVIIVTSFLLTVRYHLLIYIYSGILSSTIIFVQSFGVGWMIGSKPLIWALFGSFFFMSAYSVDLPLLRWKKSTILSVMANIFSMLISFNFGPFFHMKTVLNKAAIFPRSLVFATAVMGIFYGIITLAKDIPDIEGDKKAGLQTLPVRLGPKKVFWFCVCLLEMAYGVAIMIGASSPFLWSKIFVVLSHAIMGLFVWYRASLVDLSSTDSLQAFYMVIFKLVYAENILMLFVR
ncbi:naringenin 8-dimethylallyltransferase 2, chloroplastic isoform X2 [Arachis hypogaea]|uniref:naringenin 8-dimethylallyltransferase 2, chloroplastic isoform X2 n=1 Tax=Arachis hypogaea TaxID=3818 RepID=UPI000DED35F3|nr:naringenin 8-dimethylallyltransferase 2, chloroplastic isoform X2 [Arachis hypogaea]